MDKKLSPLLWLFIATFFIRALVPVGFMPDLSGNHVLTICSSMGTSTIIVDENNQPVSEPNNHSHQPNLNDSCPFSFLSTALLDNPTKGLPLLVAPPVTAEGMTAFILAGILPISLKNNHLSRAPPQFS